MSPGPASRMSAPPARRGAARLAGRLALALGFPLVALTVAELALRAAGIGYPTSFLLAAEVRDRPMWVDNPFYGYRYFAPAMARNPAPIAVARARPANLRRVVVLGESAAQGDPLMEFGLSRVLTSLLNRDASSNRCEVINAAMTAINSPVIVDIARQVLRTRPDLAVLYIGNNEIIGPYGPGTVFTPRWGADTLTGLRVRASGLRLAGPLRALLGRRSGAGAGWAGLEMFASHPVPADDPRLAAAYRQYGRNLSRIIRMLRRAGVRVVLCTVAVNLADCAPFGSAGPEPPDLGPAPSLPRVEEAAGRFPAHAGLQFQWARMLDAAGRTREALARYARARDLDTLRVRTDAVMNGLVRDCARRENVPLADVEARFAEAGGGRAPGSRFFVDHVHFTFEGTYVLARTVAECIAQAWPEWGGGEWAPLETCRDELLYTPWSERQLAGIMIGRRQRPPFRDQAGNLDQARRLAETVRLCDSVIRTTDLARIEARFRAAGRAAPDDFFLDFQWGAILCDAGRWAEAAAVLTNGLARVPCHFEARKLPVLALCRSGRPVDAARIMVGRDRSYGEFLADYTLEVICALKEDPATAPVAASFGEEVLRLAPRFPRRHEVHAEIRSIHRTAR